MSRSVYSENFRSSLLITFEGFAFVAYVRWLVCRQAMTQNPCYTLVAVILAEKFQSEQGVFNLFLWVGKNILLFSCIYHICDVYLYQQNR